ncbi:hypothetical protein EDD86DRAFT_112966 [Gorgonomyces haynaldii]|nr:hypothetical protein EDD86DRAFT_112966 [Gorgonomyces haynaldii]
MHRRSSSVFGSAGPSSQKAYEKLAGAFVFLASLLWLGGATQILFLWERQHACSHFKAQEGAFLENRTRWERDCGCGRISNLQVVLLLPAGDVWCGGRKSQNQDTCADMRALARLSSIHVGSKCVSSHQHRSPALFPSHRTGQTSGILQTAA